ncbi:uncharacterized protein LOC102504694 [Camelus ferus]|uniref:Uncharacterized protein LOC102504694 n=1 Tax=Camelus ferus TaxID=419612 RepID=A0A8B8SD94_CAMFR|nr:uncharacterized protein LOC102504694 [Camelus ferus]
MKLRQGKSRAGQHQLLTQLQQPPVLPLQMPFTRSMFSVVSPGLGVVASWQRCTRQAHSSGGGNWSTSRPHLAQRCALSPDQWGGWAGRASLCWFDFPALQCFQCERFNASGVCETGENFCQTQGSEECFLKKVYEGDTVSYGYQGCSSLCIPMKLFNRITTVEFKCCHDSPLCNKF